MLLLFSPSIQHALKNRNEGGTQPLSNSENLKKNYINEKIEFGEFSTSTWKAYTFSYPQSLQISEGGFFEQFFYLDYQGIPERNFRIYGISEDWRTEDYTSEDELFRRQGFTAYKLENEDIKVSGIYKSQFTYDLSDGTSARMYRVAYEKDGFVYYINVTSTRNFWDKNLDSMMRIINSIKY